MAYNVEVRRIERQPAAVVRDKCRDVGLFFAPAFGDIMAYLQKAGVPPTGAVYARYLSFVPEMEVEAGITVTEPIAGEGRVLPGEIPACEAAVAHHVGRYDRLEDAHTAVREWIAAQGRTPGGPPIEIYLNDPQSVPPDKLETDVIWPLSPKP
jgi:effector-binding domain-containing protein